jgi:hypothetical protein
MGLRETLADVLPGLRGGADRITTDEQRIRQKIAALLEQKQGLFRDGPSREELATRIRAEVQAIREKFLVAAAGAVFGFAPRVVEDFSLKAGARELPASGWQPFCGVLEIHGVNSPLSWDMARNPEGTVRLLMEAADRNANYGGPMPGKLKLIKRLDAEIVALREEHRELCQIALEHGLRLEPLPETADEIRTRQQIAYQREDHAMHERLHAKRLRQARELSAQEELQQARAEFAKAHPGRSFRDVLAEDGSFTFELIPVPEENQS